MLLLYSTNTYLAYSISERYYDRTHYFWCAPQFDGRTVVTGTVLPPTSSPAELYEAFSMDIARNDRHSDKVRQNRAGIIAGATSFHKRGRITSKQLKEIVEIVKAAQLPDFRPLLFVAPREHL